MRVINAFISAALFAGFVLAVRGPAAHGGEISRFSEKNKIRILGPAFRIALAPSVSVADWNNDGITDLIIGQYAGPICVYLRNKDGTFQDMRWIEINGQPQTFGYTALAVTDWNGDGKPDLLVVQGGSPGVELYLNTGVVDAPAFKDGEVPGFGAFKQGARITVEDKEPISDTNCSGIAVADWNGDGRPDLLLGTGKGEVRLFINKGSRDRPVLERPAPLDCKGQTTLGDPNLAVPYAADWDGDKRMDLLVMDYDGRVHLYLNKGAGPKAGLVPYEGKTGGGLLPVNLKGVVRSVVLTDWDGDGKPDLLLGESAGCLYLIREAAAVERWRPELLAGRDFNYRRFLTLAFADLNADGKEDIIAGSCNRGLHLYLNTGPKGQPAFREPLIPVPGSTWSAHLDIPGPGYVIRYVQPFSYDWDRDGKPDIIFGDYLGAVILLTNLGTAETPCFDLAREVGVNRMVLCRREEGWAVPIVVDWNKDMIPDLLVGTAAGKVLLSLNRGHPRFPSFPEFTPLKADGREINVESYASPFLTDWNGDGAQDLLVGDGKGRINLFLYDTAKAEFHGAGVLTADGVPIKVRTQSRPWMTDWNADGIADLVIIGPDDHGYCYISQGT